MTDPDTPDTTHRPAPVRRPALSQSRFVALATAVLVVAVLYFARQLLIPIALATLLAFILAPLVIRLERRGLGRVPSVLIIVFAVMSILGTTGWFMAGQVSDFAERLPGYKTRLLERVEPLRGLGGSAFGRAAKAVQEIEDGIQTEPRAPAVPAVQVEIADNSADSVQTIRGALGPLIEMLGTAGLIGVLVIFTLLQREGLRDRFVRLVGSDRMPLTTQMLEEAAKKVSDYLLAQLLVNGIQGVFVGVGLALLGVPDSLFWGITAAVLRFIPYVGPVISALGPIVVSLAVFDGWKLPLATAGMFATFELFSNNVLEPWLYGSRTGLSPLAILIAAMFWTWLWGGIGLILATPLTVCLVVMGKYVDQLHFLHLLLGDEAVLSPAARLYHRLLAGDRDGAWNVIAEQPKEKELVHVYEEVMLPALGMLAQDRQLGELDAPKRDSVERMMADLVEEAAEARAPVAGASPGALGTARDGESGRVLCLPASDAADHVAARMLALLLERDGVECETVSVAYFAGEMLEIVERSRPDVVCISHVPPPGLAPVRYLCKRLQSRRPGLPVVVGVWSGEKDAARVAQHLPRMDKLGCATRLADAALLVRQALQSARLLSNSGPTTAASAPARVAQMAD